MSPEISLKQGNKYYIEVINVQTESESTLKVFWKIPKFSEFEIIEEKFTSMYQPENSGLHSGAYLNDESIHYTFNFGPLCSTENLTSTTTHSREDLNQYLPHVMIKNALPYCHYKPSYAKTRPYILNYQWTFLWKPVRRDTYVYPYKDYTNVKYSKSFEATPLHAHEAKDIWSLFFQKVHQNYPG